MTGNVNIPFLFYFFFPEEQKEKTIKEMDSRDARNAGAELGTFSPGGNCTIHNLMLESNTLEAALVWGLFYFFGGEGNIDSACQ